MIAKLKDKDDEKNPKEPDLDFFSVVFSRQFIDPSQPWVLAKNGSFNGNFDFIPEFYRVGPWHPLARVAILSLIAITTYVKPQNVWDGFEIVDAPELYSFWWYYNVFGFLWLFGVFMHFVVVFPLALGTYTVVSWTFLCIRHGITALSPFLSPDSPLLFINELTRFLSMATATMTFGVWNFCIFPTFYFGKNPDRKKAFMEFNTCFRNVQTHYFNIVFAVLSNISTFPRRSFNESDLFVSLVYSSLYSMGYTFICDRLGVHLYPHLSPRTPYMIAHWYGGFLMYIGCFRMWNYCIENGTFSFFGE